MANSAEAGIRLSGATPAGALCAVNSTLPPAVDKCWLGTCSVFKLYGDRIQSYKVMVFWSPDELQTPPSLTRAEAGE